MLNSNASEAQYNIRIRKAAAVDLYHVVHCWVCGGEEAQTRQPARSKTSRIKAARTVLRNTHLVRRDGGEIWGCGYEEKKAC